MNLSEKSAYLKGLMDGLKLDQEAPEGKMISGIVELLQEVTGAIGDLQENAEAVSDELDEIEDDLDAIEDYLMDDDDEEDGFMDDDGEDFDYDDDTMYEAAPPVYRQCRADLPEVRRGPPSGRGDAPQRFRRLPEVRRAARVRVRRGRRSLILIRKTQARSRSLCSAPVCTSGCTAA